MVPSESDIPPALDLRKIVISPHVTWYSIPANSQAPALCAMFFAALDFKLAPLLQHPWVSPLWESMVVDIWF